MSTKAICGSSCHFLWSPLWIPQAELVALLWSQSTLLTWFGVIHLTDSPIRLKSLKDKDGVSYTFGHLWCPEQCLAHRGNSIIVDWISKWLGLGSAFTSQEADSGADGPLASCSGFADSSSLLIYMFISPVPISLLEYVLHLLLTILWVSGSFSLITSSKW